MDAAGATATSHHDDKEGADGHYSNRAEESEGASTKHDEVTDNDDTVVELDSQQEQLGPQVEELDERKPGDREGSQEDHATEREGKDEEAAASPTFVEVDDHAASKQDDQGPPEEEGEIADESEADDGDGAEEVSADDDESPAAGGFVFQSRAALFEALRHRPCRLERVELRGLNRTRPALVESHLAAAKAAATYEEVVAALLAARQELLALGIFSACRMTLDAAPDAAPGSASLLLEAEEEGLLAANAGTFVQGQERSSEVRATLRNAAGWAEALDLSAGVAHGAGSAAPWLAAGNSFALHLALPALRPLLALPPGGPPLAGEVRLFQSTRDRQQDASHVQCHRGVAAAVHSGPHEAAYELTWRENMDPSGRSSPAVRRELGHSLLASLRYRHLVDRLDSPAWPRRGYRIELSAELAGLGFDPKLTRFFRPELQVTGALPLPFSNAALAASLHAAALLPWSLQPLALAAPPSASASTSSAPLINDRLFLGGPASLRGFLPNAVGPCDRRAAPLSSRDFLGGDLLLSAVAALSFQLPVAPLRERGIHGHLFACAGTLLPFAALHRAASAAGSRLEALPALAQRVAASVRLSVGAGLVWPLPVGRLEVNYCLVLRRQASDKTVQHGWQLGLVSSL